MTAPASAPPPSPTDASAGRDEVSRRWQWLALAALVGVVLWQLAPMLTPFVISALLAWMGDPLVDRLEARGRSRTTAVVLVFALMTLVLAAVLVVLLPMLYRQVALLVESLPTYLEWFRGTALPWIEARARIDLGEYIDPGYLVEAIKGHWQEAGGAAATVLGHIGRSGLALMGFAANVVLVPLVTFYFLRDWDLMVARVRDLLPRPLEPTVARLAKESDVVLGAFLRGQLLVMLGLGTIYSLGLWAVGVDLALLIGMLAGVLSFVPYLGTAIGVIAAVIATLVQHGDALHVGLVLGVFVAGQMIEGYVLTPWLVGERIGLGPVAVIFAVMAGGQLFGFLGVLIALPVAAVVNVLLRYAHERYTASRLYGADEGAGPPPAAPAEAADAGDAAAPPAPPSA